MADENLKLEAYKDVAQPAARKVGDTLARTVQVALAPFRGLIWGLETIEEYILGALNTKLKNVPLDNISAPPANVAGPIIEALRFTGSIPPLREMFANLLAHAMVKDDSKRAHPSFVEVIKQLSPDEALILFHISDKSGDFILTEEWKNYGGSTDETIESQFERFCVESSVKSPELSGTYLDNLLRVRIFAESQLPEAVYFPPGYTERGNYEGYVQNNFSRTVAVTSFGKSFIQVCAKEPA